MKLNWAAAIVAAFFMSVGASAAHADSISSVENARAKERAGRNLNRQDVESLRRYGGNDDAYRYRDYGYGAYYSDSDVYDAPRYYRYDSYSYRY